MLDMAEYSVTGFGVRIPSLIELVISETAMNKLIEKALNNLGNGGRGIGNIVESLLINPLARYLFDEGISENVKIVLNDIDAENMPYALSCTYEALK